MSKITRFIIKLGEFTGVMLFGVSLAVFFEYGFPVCYILLVESIVLTALSKVIAYQTRCYERDDEQA